MIPHMKWLQSLLGSAESQSDVAGSDTVRKIARELDELPPDQARHVAAFAYVLGRVAYADRHVSEEETASMETIVREIGGLPAAQAVLTVEIAKAQNKLFGGTESFIVTKEFQGSTNLEERQQLLDAMFAVSAADDSISTEEEASILQISKELGFGREDFIKARTQWSEKRSVIQRLRNRQP